MDCAIVGAWARRDVGTRCARENPACKQKQERGGRQRGYRLSQLLRIAADPGWEGINSARDRIAEGDDDQGDDYASEKDQRTSNQWRHSSSVRDRSLYGQRSTRPAGVQRRVCRQASGFASIYSYNVHAVESIATRNESQKLAVSRPGIHVTNLLSDWLSFRSRLEANLGRWLTR